MKLKIDEKMWYRITLKYLTGKISSGIRYTDDTDAIRVQFRILDTVKQRYGLNGRVTAVDISKLEDNHPEVVAILTSGKEIPKLKMID